MFFTSSRSIRLCVDSHIAQTWHNLLTYLLYKLYILRNFLNLFLFFLFHCILSFLILTNLVSVTLCVFLFLMCLTSKGINKYEENSCINILCESVQTILTITITALKTIYIYVYIFNYIHIKIHIYINTRVQNNLSSYNTSTTEKKLHISDELLFSRKKSLKHSLIRAKNGLTRAVL